jgi:hypothetical protein
MMTRRPFFAVAALAPCTLFTLALAQPPATTPSAPAPSPAAQPATDSVAPFQRTIEEQGGEVIKLQMAVREFAPPKPGMPKVYLAGAVHIANEAFYKDLQSFLDAQDVVLFEGVKPPGAGSSEHDQGTMSDEQKAEATKRRVRFLAMAVSRYQSKNGKLPESLDDLVSNSEGRIAQLLKNSTSDAWGHPLTYSVSKPTPAKADGDDAHAAKVQTYDIVSLGADNKPGGDGPNADIRFSDQKPLSKPETGDRSGGIQQKLADALGLVFQLKAMDNNKPNWRNSDLSLDQVQARLDAAGANADMLFSMLDGSSFMGKMAGFLLDMMSATAESRAMLRVMMIEMLGKADLIMAAKMPGDMSKMMAVIVEDRNAVVLADLKRILETEPNVKSVAVIYGAGHLPSMQKALVKDFAYTPAGDTWRTAMEVNTTDAGITATQLKSMREMIGHSLDAQLGTSRKRVAPVPTEPKSD